MKKSLILLIILASLGCNRINRFHDKEIALEAEYVSIVLDNIHQGNYNEDIDVISHYFVNDSTLVWSMDPAEGMKIGWEGFKTRKELSWMIADSIKVKLKKRIINMDDMGSVAWFSESVDLNYLIGDSLVSKNDVLVSGVLQKLGHDWRIVQYHTTFL